MKAWIFSDLHLECNEHPASLCVPDADICICAGDVLDGGVGRSIRWLRDHIAPSMPVVFVAGNHEHYRSSLSEGLKAGHAEASKCDRVHFLDDSSVVVNDWRFVGGTLWTDFRLFGDPLAAASASRAHLNDYRRIRFRTVPYKALSPRDTMQMHYAAKARFAEFMSTDTEHPTVVVSHHAPSPQSVPPRYVDDPLTPSFASDLEAEILRFEPALWVHGHIHTASDYFIGKTRVICNPRGYPDEHLSSTFDPTLVLQLDDLRNA